MSMTTDEILARLEEYQNIYNKFEKSIPQWMIEKMKTDTGKDFSELGPMFHAIMRVMKFSREKLDESPSLRYAISNHLIEYESLFDAIKALIKKVNET